MNSEKCIICDHERQFDSDLQEWEPSYSCPCCDEYVCDSCWSMNY